MDKLRTVSIRRSLLLNLVGIVLLLGVTIFGMTFLGGRAAMKRVSQSLIDQASARTELELKRFFDPVSRQLLLLHELGRSGRLELDTPEDLDALMGAFMKQHPWVTSGMVADDTGREHMLLREGELWRSRRFGGLAKGRRAIWWEWSEGPAEGSRSEEELDYDPRERPWYVGAEESKQADGDAPWLYWTEPYTFFTTKEPGITASTAFTGPDGSLRVLGLDVLLTDISRFTTRLEVHGQGFAFVLSDDGRLIGIPKRASLASEEGLKELLLKRPEELETPLAYDAATALLGPGRGATGATRFTSQGDAWWGEVRPFTVGSGRTLQIGVAVPERDLLPNVRETRIWVGVVTLVALGLAIGRAVSLARGYSRPIEKLVDESERMSTGDLEAWESIESEITEMHQLADAHDRMRVGLMTLLKIEHDLKIARSIQESTFPERLPGLEGFEIAAWNEPADETGGDTYDVIGVHGASIGDQVVLTDGQAARAVLLLADATGHGIGPALSVTQLRAMLRIAVRAGLSLSDIATHLNQQLCADLPDGRFITCWLGEIRSGEHVLSTLSAGQGPLLLYRAANDSFEMPDTDTQPFGLLDLGPIEAPPPLELQPGDIYAVISDGIFESTNSRKEEYGVEEVQKVIRQHRGESAETIKDEIQKAEAAFSRGSPAADDRTILIIKRV
jgi:serine phosphatase RsbU (regulator of sigma subunit)